MDINDGTRNNQMISGNNKKFGCPVRSGGPAQYCVFPVEITG
jgi:hypothetical protein